MATDTAPDENRNLGVSIALAGMLVGVVTGSCLPIILAGLLSIMVNHSSREKHLQPLDAQP